MRTGFKLDTDKLRMDLIPPEAEEGIARAMTYGARKYPPRNWEKGMEWMRLYSALRRHLLSWMSGEELDKESGLPHLDHAGACMVMLMGTVRRKIGTDDRPQVASTCSKCGGFGYHYGACEAA